MNNRQTGTVKYFDSTRGFGFIAPDDGGRDVFVHISAVEHSGMSALVEGNRVSFDPEQDKRGRGPQAVNLTAA